MVGVTAGASAPEELVDQVIHFLSPVGGVELVDVTEEDEYFGRRGASGDANHAAEVAGKLA
ncbi:MAG: hypothetical protein AAFY28_17085, partial [Actinomycetota bacterium]